MSCIQIEVTNHCNMVCKDCTRMIGLIKEPYFMTLERVEQALQSLEGFKGIIGIMGGEPTMHPQFAEICKLFEKYVFLEQRGLWTNGFMWNENEFKYDKIIRDTFLLRNIVYNAHDYEYINQHQPILIPSWKIIQDRKLWKEIIDNCWIQNSWSACINPKGGYFCEVAGALDMLYDLNINWKIEPGWWKKEVKDFTEQIETYCKRCSGAIPFGNSNPKQYNRLNPYIRIDYEKNKIGWKPYRYRNFHQHEPGKREY